MRIGITGTHSTGKTTLLREMSRLPQFRGYQICDEVTRWVKSLGFNINEQGTDVTQELIMMRHIYNFWTFENMITDRITLDCYVYSKYLYLHDRISDVTFMNIERVFLKALDEFVYDYVFFLSPEFPIQDDNVRSVDVDFQKDIHALFNQVIDSYDLANHMNLTPISGSVEARVHLINLYTGK